jgi:hypothetical protein
MKTSDRYELLWMLRAQQFCYFIEYNYEDEPCTPKRSVWSYTYACSLAAAYMTRMVL